MMTDKDWKDLEGQILGTILARNQEINPEEAAKQTNKMIGKLRTSPKSKKVSAEVAVAMKRVESEVKQKSQMKMPK